MPALTRGLGRGVAALALALVTICGSSASTGAEEPVEWGVRTASTDQGESRDNFAYTLDPGASLDDAIVVTNRSDGPIALATYASDGFTTSSGQLDVVTRNTPSTKVGAWVSLGQPQLALDPGESVEVPFTVSVPPTVTPGDYAGAVLTSLTVPDVEEGVSVDRRLGIRMHVRVTGDLSPRLSIENPTLRYHHSAHPAGRGSATIRYTIHNVGNVRLAAKQKVSASGPFGWWTSDAPVPDAPELLPGETWSVSVTLADVVPAFVVATTVELTPLAGATELDPVRADTSASAPPWASIALLLALATLGLARHRIRRRRLASRQATQDDLIRAAVDQALLER